MEDRKVGIVLVNYNGSGDTIECLKSLRGLSWENMLTVVVDNCSTDDSVQVLRPEEERLCFRLLCAEANRGFSAGNNIGIRYALEQGCTHVLLLNNDTVVTPDFLSEMMRHDDGKTVLTGTILYYWKQDTVWYGGGSVNPYTGKTVHLHKEEPAGAVGTAPAEISFASGCEMLIPGQVIDAVGLMDEDYFLYGEDVDYCLRIAGHGFRLMIVPSSVIYHKVSASTSKISKATQYYSARNRRLLIYRNLKGVRIVTALLYTHAQTIHRILQKRLTVKCVLAGIADYYRKRFGKTDRVF